MRVLMLGWEFPPHMSGGLGTACFGITEGLSANGVEVIFVIPRASGDEAESGAEVVGANRVRLSAPAAWPSPEAAREREPETSLAEADRGNEQARAARLFELLRIDSPLAPYQTQADYAERLEKLPEQPRLAGPLDPALRRVLELPASGDPEQLESWLRAVRPASGDADDAGLFLEFSGAYGRDLISEVARYAIVVAELARQRDFDLVHAHDWMTLPAGVVAARIKRKPLVMHVHACEYDRSGENVNPQVRDIEQIGMDAADRVVCVSHYTAGLLRRRYRVDPAKLRVVHNAVKHREQAREWHAEKSIEEPIVLFLGRVTFQKGPDYFLEAAARVVSIEPRVKFVVSGSGDMLSRMIEQAAMLGIARNIHFTGFLRGADVERMYAMADIYVMPSVSEPFGISPLEAMALDVPVIVSRQSGVSEILSNALKVDFWDVDDIANKILALLRYPALSDYLIEEGKDEVRKFRWDQQGRLLKQVYEELLP